MVAGYEIFASGKFFLQMPDVFAFEECQIAENVDHIFLVHGRPPEVEQPGVVSLGVVPVGKRPIRLIPEYVPVAEMQVGGKKYLIHIAFVVYEAIAAGPLHGLSNSFSGRLFQSCSTMDSHIQ